jgi:ADP-heptose:LPS heptosyltransferase
MQCGAERGLRNTVGFGDEIIGTGLARGAAARGKKIAFGDGSKISWGPWCVEMFKHNPNIAPPGSEGQANLEWINHCKGHRLYNKLENGKWIWNYDFKVKSGEFYFDARELAFADKYQEGFVVIEPNVPWQKTVAPNKDWGESNYKKVAKILLSHGFRVAQFYHNNSRRIIEGATIINAPDFRNAISVLSKARLYIGPEGGMHHASAAVGVPAVVLFGGFIPPGIMGYGNQTCLTGGATACGNISPCSHCRDAMNRISVDEVMTEATRRLQ